jgi:threonine dehydrogenase-like Zn-dependent dehydrogenase
MKAVVIEKPGEVVLRDVPDPKPGPGDVLVRPVAGGICGTDVHILEGNFLGDYPVIPCHEFSGEVVELGRGVEKVAVGDLVTVDPNIRCGRCRYCLSSAIHLCENYEAVGVTRPGGFARLVSVPAGNVHRLESGDCFSAAFAEPLACVLYGRSRVHAGPGTEVIVWGAGAIGLLHMQVFSRLAGCSVTLVDRDPERLEKGSRLGAVRTFPAGTSLEEQLRDIRPDGWPVAVEATGSTGALQSVFSHLSPGGHVLVFGVYPKEDCLSLSPFEIYRNDWRISGSFTYMNEFSAAVRLVSWKKLDVLSLIDVTIGLEEVSDTLIRMSRGERPGKVQVRM